MRKGGAGEITEIILLFLRKEIHKYDYVFLLDLRMMILMSS